MCKAWGTVLAADVATDLVTTPTGSTWSSVRGGIRLAPHSPGDEDTQGGKQSSQLSPQHCCLPALRHLRLPGESSSPTCSYHPCLRALGQAQTPGHHCWARWAGSARGFNRTPPTPWHDQLPCWPWQWCPAEEGPGKKPGRRTQ